MFFQQDGGEKLLDWKVWANTQNIVIFRTNDPHYTVPEATWLQVTTP